VTFSAAETFFLCMLSASVCSGLWIGMYIHSCPRCSRKPKQPCWSHDDAERWGVMGGMSHHVECRHNGFEGRFDSDCGSCVEEMLSENERLKRDYEVLFGGAMQASDRLLAQIAEARDIILVSLAFELGTDLKEKARAFLAKTKPDAGEGG
jgi:hypothetical protein